MLPQFFLALEPSIPGYLLVLSFGSSIALKLTDTTCGGIRCYGSTQCCGNGCCALSVYDQAWFWVVLVLGLLALLAVLVLVCRWLYRYHNASQYTKLRLQQQPEHHYGTIRYRAMTGIPPPSYEQEDDTQLPSYASVTSKPPPYSTER